MLEAKLKLAQSPSQHPHVRDSLPSCGPGVRLVLDSCTPQYQTSPPGPPQGVCNVQCTPLRPLLPGRQLPAP